MTTLTHRDRLKTVSPQEAAHFPERLKMDPEWRTRVREAYADERVPIGLFARKRMLPRRAGRQKVA